MAAFVGFGVEAIYPSPQYPNDEQFYGEAYEGGVSTEDGATVGAPEEATAQEVPPGEFVEPGMTPGMIESEKAFAQQERAYREELSEHNRVASLLVIGAAALLLVAGWVPVFGRLPVIGDGLTLGGTLTLIYGLALGIQVESNLFRFLVVSSGTSRIAGSNSPEASLRRPTKRLTRARLDPRKKGGKMKYSAHGPLISRGV